PGHNYHSNTMNMGGIGGRMSTESWVCTTPPPVDYKPPPSQSSADMMRTRSAGTQQRQSHQLSFEMDQVASMTIKANAAAEPEHVPDGILGQYSQQQPEIEIIAASAASSTAGGSGKSKKRLPRSDESENDDNSATQKTLN